jgi:hypothetical protein
MSDHTGQSDPTRSGIGAIGRLTAQSQFAAGILSVLENRFGTRAERTRCDNHRSVWSRLFDVINRYHFLRALFRKQF